MSEWFRGDHESSMQALDRSTYPAIPGENSVEGIARPPLAVLVHMARPGVMAGGVVLANLVASEIQVLLSPDAGTWIPAQRALAMGFNAVLFLAFASMYLFLRHRTHATTAWNAVLRGGATSALVTGAVLTLSIGWSFLPLAVWLVVILAGVLIGKGAGESHAAPRLQPGPGGDKGKCLAPVDGACRLPQQTP